MVGELPQRGKDRTEQNLHKLNILIDIAVLVPRDMWFSLFYEQVMHSNMYKVKLFEVCQ